MDMEMTPEQLAAAAGRRRRREARRAASVPGQPIAPAARDGGGRVDVLSILGVFPTWVACRGHRQRQFLASHGIRHGWTHAAHLGPLSREISDRNPRLVLNEVWRVDPGTMASLAARFPAIQFVALTHATPAWISTERAADHYAFLRLAREQSNCHYGTVMTVDRVVAPRGTKVVSLPNLCTIPQGLSGREAGPPTVSLVARDNQSIKQWGASIAAVEIAARRIPDLHVLVGAPALRDGAAPHLDHLQEIGIPTIRAGWGSWRSYLSTVARHVDVHLTATLSESFCLVPLEHCLLGRPVVGTPAIEWLPGRWQRNPQDPADLASTLVSHFEDYSAAAAKAIGVARNVAEKNHRHLRATFENLLGV